MVTRPSRCLMTVDLRLFFNVISRSRMLNIAHSGWTDARRIWVPIDKNVPHVLVCQTAPWSLTLSDLSRSRTTVTTYRAQNGENYIHRYLGILIGNWYQRFGILIDLDHGWPSTGLFKVTKWKSPTVTKPLPLGHTTKMFPIPDLVKVRHDPWPRMTLRGHFNIFKVTKVKVAYSW